MTNIDNIEFDGDHNLGLHTEATDKFCLISSKLSPRCKDKVEEVLDVDVLEANVANSGMLGIFCSGNSNGIVLPPNTEEIEKKILRDFDLDIKVLQTKYTALGNLILVNDKAALISEKISEHKETISEHLDVPVEIGKIAGLDMVGSCGVTTNEGLLLHRNAKNREIEQVEELFDCEAGIGTANFGSPFVGALITANSKGLLTSHRTTGYELGRIEQALYPND